MDGLVLALLIKPLAIAAMAPFYFVCVILVLRWLYPRLPKSRFVDFLFKERANRRPDYGPGFEPSNAAGPRALTAELLTDPTVPAPRGNIG